MTQLQSPSVGEPELISDEGVLNRTFSLRATALKWVAGMLALAIISFFATGNAYYVNVWSSALLFAGLATAWNIIGGYGGQFSLGHSVFFGIGAYSTVLLTTAGWGVLAPIAVGIVLSVLVAWGIAAPLFRLRGHFFAISTLALTIVAAALANYFPWTGGPAGVRLPFTESMFQHPADYVWLMLAFVGLCTVVSTYIKHTRLGYSLFAIRDDQDAARAVGINPLVTKSQGFLISAALTGLGGGFFAHFVGFVDPLTAFDLQEVGVRLPLLALIGGIGTVYGPVIGALIMQPVADIIRGEFGGRIPGLDLIIFSVILILAALFFKKGLAGTIQTIDIAIRRRWRKRGK